MGMESCRRTRKERESKRILIYNAHITKKVNFHNLILTMMEKPIIPKLENASEDEEISDAVEEELLKIEKVTEEDLERIMGKYFTETCGDYGKEEFYSFVIPTVKKIYGDNFRKAGLRLLDIINKGASLKPKEIGDYFKNAFSKEELEYSEKSKKEIINEMIENINDLIAEKKKRYGEKYKGVVGVIVFGSFAKNNFTLESDLDIAFVLETDEKGVYLEKEEKYIDYTEDFEKDLEKKIKREIMNFTSIGLEKNKNLREIFSREMLESAVVISPSEDVKAKLRKYLKK